MHLDNAHACTCHPKQANGTCECRVAHAAEVAAALELLSPSTAPHMTKPRDRTQGLWNMWHVLQQWTPPPWTRQAPGVHEADAPATLIRSHDQRVQITTCITHQTTKTAHVAASVPAAPRSPPLLPQGCAMQGAAPKLLEPAAGASPSKVPLRLVCHNPSHACD